MMRTHYDAPKSVNLEVKQSIKTSYEATSEKIINI